MSGIVGSLFNHRGSGIVAKLGTDGHTFNSAGAGKKAISEAVVVVADGVDGSKLADDAVDSEHYTDGSIDNAHIADDAIDSEHYAAGSIDTAHIADDQITLAKMAAGTDGNLISFDTSGNPVAVATGSDGQVLTSAGAGAVCLFEDAAGGGANTPYFHATVSAAVAISATTVTFPSLTETVDSGGEFASDRFTPQTAGFYYVLWSLFIYDTLNANKLERIDADLTFNGTNIHTGYFRNNDGFRSATAVCSMIKECDGSSDYFTFQAYCDTSSGTGTIGVRSTALAFKLI